MGRMKIPTVTASTVPAQLKPFPKGVSGNPKGRVMGSRQKLTEGFIKDLSKYYEVEGASLIKRVGDEQPAMLLQVIARLLPKDINLNVAADLTADITAEQRRRIAESWILSQGNAPDILEAQAVRVYDQEPVAALPDCSEQGDDQDELPDREPEPVTKRASNAGVHRQAKRPVHSKIISSGARRDD